MRPPGSSSLDEREDDSRWRTAGDRIQTLLDASASAGTVARQRAEQLAREITDLYGAALERIIQVADRDLTERLVADELVASLLLVHGLHPHRIERRVADALDRVRPYLGSHGGDIQLLEVGVPDRADHQGDPDDIVVRLQFTGSCKSCPSSAVTLELAVEDAVRAAAPEIGSIEVVAAEANSPAAVIPAESLLTRVHADRHGPTAWQPVPSLSELAAGEVGGFSVLGTAALVCRVGENLFAYRDQCPVCTSSLAGAVLTKSLICCPSCDASFDVVHAGAGRGHELHLEPIPLLVRDGVLSMALPEAVAP